MELYLFSDCLERVIFKTAPRFDATDTLQATRDLRRRAREGSFCPF